MDWPDKIEQYIEVGGLKWAQLARNIRYRSVNTLSRDVRERRVRVDELVIIAKALRFDVAWLLDPKTDWPPDSETQVKAAIESVQNADHWELQTRKAAVASAKKVARKRRASGEGPRRADRKGA